MPSAPYYRHDDPTGSALNNVAANPAPYDELINGNRVFTYKPKYGMTSYGHQGITHPAPVYYANQPQPQAQMGYYMNQAVSSRALLQMFSSYLLGLTQPSPPTYYYTSSPSYTCICNPNPDHSYYCLHHAAYAASPDTPMGYFYAQSITPSYTCICIPNPDHSYYCLHRAAYAASPDTPTGYHYSQPPTYCQAQPYMSYTSPQYATAAPGYPSQPSSTWPGYPYPTYASGSGSTTLPDGTTLFLGKTKEEVQYENEIIADRTGANKPIQMAPFKPHKGQQFWCRELDGTWTLRNLNETMDLLQPGKWETSASGHAVFIRQKP